MALVDFSIWAKEVSFEYQMERVVDQELVHHWSKGSCITTFREDNILLNCYESCIHNAKDQDKGKPVNLPPVVNNEIRLVPVLDVGFVQNS